MRNLTPIAALLLVLGGSGCREAEISVYDAWRSSDNPSTLEVRLEDPHQHKCNPIEGVPVRFYTHDACLGVATTDENGVARLECRLPADVTQFRAEARVDDRPLRTEGLVFDFPMGRTVIVCDIDGTISMTHFRELVFNKGDDIWSKPLPDSPETLTRLSGRFGIVYLTARPGFLLGKTKRWLAANGFPQAPVIAMPSLAESINPQKFKSERIECLQRAVGNVGIGIGDANTDSEAYAMTDLLPIIVDSHDDRKFRAHTLVMRDWKMIARFFDANRGVLEDPARLRTALQNEELILRPIIRYQKL